MTSLDHLDRIPVIPDSAPVLDTRQPSPARRYDYWLGGKDNFAVDRRSGDAIEARFPDIRTAAMENRRFLHRVVAYLAGEAGVDQFLDIGTGLPTSPNVHEIAQAANPTARIVYVDNDPMVVTHARALTDSHPDGAVDYVQADLRESHRLLAHPGVRTTLDLSRPVAVLMVAVLHFIDDHDDPHRAVTRLAEALAPGSFVAISHATFDPLPAATVARLAPMVEHNAGHGVFRPRTRTDVAAFLAGLDPVEPELTSIVDWRPDLPPVPQATPERVACYGAVARRP